MWANYCLVKRPESNLKLFFPYFSTVIVFTWDVNYASHYYIILTSFKISSPFCPNPDSLKNLNNHSSPHGIRAPKAGDAKFLFSVLRIPAASAPRAHTWFGGCRPVLQFQRRPRLLVQFRVMLTRFMSKEVVLVDVHHQEFIKLHVLVPLQGRAVAGPTQPLEVDTQALRELRVREKPESAECQEWATGSPRKQRQQRCVVWAHLP